MSPRSAMQNGFEGAKLMAIARRHRFIERGDRAVGIACPGLGLDPRASMPVETERSVHGAARPLRKTASACRISAPLAAGLARRPSSQPPNAFGNVPARPSRALREILQSLGRIKAAAGGRHAVEFKTCISNSADGPSDVGRGRVPPRVVQGCRSVRSRVRPRPIASS